LKISPKNLHKTKSNNTKENSNKSQSKYQMSTPKNEDALENGGNIGKPLRPPAPKTAANRREIYLLKMASGFFQQASRGRLEILPPLLSGIFKTALVCPL
jgi:hypothetical protein